MAAKRVRHTRPTEKKNCLPLTEEAIRETFRQDRADVAEFIFVAWARSFVPSGPNGSEAHERIWTTSTVTWREPSGALRRSNDQLVEGSDEIPMAMIKRL